MQSKLDLPRRLIPCAAQQTADCQGLPFFDRYHDVSSQPLTLLKHPGKGTICVTIVWYSRARGKGKIMSGKKLLAVPSVLGTLHVALLAHEVTSPCLVSIKAYVNFFRKCVPTTKNPGISKFIQQICS